MVVIALDARPRCQVEGDMNRVTDGLINHMHSVDKVLEAKQRPIAPPSPVPKRVEAMNRERVKRLK